MREPIRLGQVGALIGEACYRLLAVWLIAVL